MDHTFSLHLLIEQVLPTLPCRATSSPNSCIDSRVYHQSSENMLEQKSTETNYSVGWGLKTQVRDAQCTGNQGSTFFHPPHTPGTHSSWTFHDGLESVAIPPHQSPSKHAKFYKRSAPPALPPLSGRYLRRPRPRLCIHTASLLAGVAATTMAWAMPIASHRHEKMASAIFFRYWRNAQS